MYLRGNNHAITEYFEPVILVEDMIFHEIFPRCTFVDKVRWRRVSRRYCMLLTEQIVKIPWQDQNELTDDVPLALTNLRSLSIRKHALITGVTLHTLKNLTHLAVDFPNRFTSDAIHNLPSSLVDVKIHWPEFIGVLPFKNLTNLKRLNLKLSNFAVPPNLNAMTSLTDLTITQRHRYISPRLDELTGLTRLNLTNVGPDASFLMADVKKMPNLTYLGLRGRTRFEADALFHLPALTALNLSANLHANQHQLSRLTTLKTLIAGGLSAVSNGCLHSMSFLTTLDLTGNPWISRDTLSCLTNLTSLSLKETSGDKVKALLAHKKLTELNLRGATVRSFRTVRELVAKGVRIQF